LYFYGQKEVLGLEEYLYSVNRLYQAKSACDKLEIYKIKAESLRNIFFELKDNTYTKAINLYARKKMKNLLFRMLEYKNTCLRMIDIHSKIDKKYDNLLLQSILNEAGQQENYYNFAKEQETMTLKAIKDSIQKKEYQNLFAAGTKITKEEQDILNINSENIKNKSIHRKFKLKNNAINELKLSENNCKKNQKKIKKKIEEEEEENNSMEDETAIRNTKESKLNSGEILETASGYSHTAFNENLKLGDSKINYKPKEKIIINDKMKFNLIKKKQEKAFKFIFEDDQIKKLKKTMGLIENFGLTLKTEENKQSDSINIDNLTNYSIVKHKKNLSMADENKFSNVQFLEYEDKTFANLTKDDFLGKIDLIRNLKHHKKSRSNNFSFKNVQYNTNLPPVVNFSLLKKIDFNSNYTHKSKS